MGGNEIATKATSTKLKQKSRINWNLWLPIIPLLLWLSLLLVFPHIRLFLMSLMERGQQTIADGGITATNYLAPFLDPDRLFIKIFARTILFSLLNTLLTLAVTYPIAFAIAKVLKGNRKIILLLLIALPYYISELIRVYAWMNILRETGFLNYLLVDMLHIFSEPVEFLYNNSALFVVFVYTSTLLMLLPIYSSLDGMPDEQIQAAQDLGAGPLATFFYVVFPYSLPGVTAGCILVFMMNVGDYLVPTLIGGKNNLWVTEMIYNRFIISTNWNLGSAYSLVMLVLTSIVVWLGLRLSGQTLRGVFSEQ